jgi:hyperosmotically inducible periplasmic protein
MQPLVTPHSTAPASPRPLHIAALALAILCVPNLLMVRSAAAQDQSTQPDNSAQNKNQATTADNQTNAQDDRMTTAKVRKAIIADKDLSTYAHNVKIVTVNGTVTLKGPVKSDEEKQKVNSDAASVVSQDKIVDHLTVKQQ